MSSSSLSWPTFGVLFSEGDDWILETCTVLPSLVLGFLSPFCRALDCEAFPSSLVFSLLSHLSLASCHTGNWVLDTTTFIPLHLSAFSRDFSCRTRSTRSCCAEAEPAFLVLFLSKVCNVPAYACAGGAGTLKFGMVTLENILLVVQKRQFWIFFFFLVTKCLFHITNQWLTLQFMVGRDCSPSRAETLQALLESVLE